MAHQPDLFGRSERPIFDPTFAGIERLALDTGDAGGDPGAWIDLLPGWLRGHDTLFAELEAAARWRAERRPMYDQVVDVPRLLASFPEDCPVHPIVEGMRRALSERYADEFQFVSLALYRDGNDSVAWHGDRIARTIPTAHVATVSLGTPRKFLLRPAEGGAARTLNLGWGDLLVMGGTCQRTWRHAVPKVASALPRMTIQFRPAWFAPARY